MKSQLQHSSRDKRDASTTGPQWPTSTIARLRVQEARLLDEPSAVTRVDIRSPWYDAESQAEELLLAPARPAELYAVPPASVSDAPMYLDGVELELDTPLLPKRARGTRSPSMLHRSLPEPAPEVINTPEAPPISDLDVQLPAPSGLLRRMWKGERLMHYNRLIVGMLAANAVLAYLSVQWLWWQGGAQESVALLSDIVLGNFAVAILFRQHHVINALFWMATRAPTRWPLGIRATLAKVYHFGGIHVGGAISGTLWYVALVATSLWHASSLALSQATYSVLVVQAALLVFICAVSRPKVRQKHHDFFEVCKRFSGWASLGLFWAQTVLLMNDQLAVGASLGHALLVAPQTWVLALITFSVALPWLRLRRVPVDIAVPSNHVGIASFDYGVTPFAGSSTALSRNPLLEWHSFANIPTPGKSGYRLAISRAGDWTGALISDKPSHLWVKGIPTAGVANIEVLFKRVLYVATGSGIGPCLPHLLGREVPARLFWATRNARKTYGDALVDEILAKHPDAIIWDTDLHGKPDMVKMAYRLVQETGAEAAICISNKKLTWQVVRGLESRGIPAYGAIWDS